MSINLYDSLTLIYRILRYSSSIIKFIYLIVRTLLIKVISFLSIYIIIPYLTDINWFNYEYIPNKIPKSIAISCSYKYINRYDNLYDIENKINNLVSSLKYIIKLEIPDVCIYDPDGIFLKNYELLYKIASKELLDCEITIKRLDSNSTNKEITLFSTINNFKQNRWTNSLNILLVSSSESFGFISNISRLASVYEDSAEKFQFDNYFPAWNQPQLVITIGPSDSLYGFPPWLLRCAEIGHISSLNSYSLNDVFRKYSISNQRYGV